MGNQGSNLDTPTDVTITINPTFETITKDKDFSDYRGKINNTDILQYFKSNKLKKNYFLGIPGYKYKILDTKMKGKKVVYIVKYTKNNEKNNGKSEKYFSEYIKDGLHKETHAGNPKFFKKIGKDKVYIFINYKNVSDIFIN